MKIRTKHRWRLTLGALLAALMLAGCGSPDPLAAGIGWPGLSASGDTIYLSYGKVYAFDQEGGLQWSYPEKLGSGQAFFAPPAIADDMVVAADHLGTVFAIDPATGAEKWKHPVPPLLIGGVELGEQTVYVGTPDGKVHALDASSDGKEVWTYPKEGSIGAIWSTPLLDGDTLYITSMDRHVYALDALTGAEMWKFPASDGEANSPIGQMVSTPTLHKGILYFGSFNKQVHALDTQTHELVWSSAPTGNWVWSSPAIDEENGLVIAADLDGHIFAVHLNDGSQEWGIDIEGSVVGAPLVSKLADGTSVVYIASSGQPNLRVLKTVDGKEVSATAITGEFDSYFLMFKTSTDARPISILSSPIVIDDGLLLLGAHEGKSTLYGLDANTLAEKWTPISPQVKDTDLQAAKNGGAAAPSSGLFSDPLLTTLLMASLGFLVYSLLRPRPKKS